MATLLQEVLMSHITEGAAQGVAVNQIADDYCREPLGIC
jgi:hypothetical protein